MSKNKLRDMLEEALRTILKHAAVDDPISMDRPTYVILGPGRMEYKPAEGDAPPQIAMRSDESAVVVTDDGVSARVNAIKKVCSGSKYEGKFSEKSVGQYLDAVVRTAVLGEGGPSVDDMVTELFRLLEQPEQEWEVFVPLLNVKLPEAASPYKCGDFELVVPTPKIQGELRSRVKSVVMGMKGAETQKTAMESQLWSAIEAIQPAVWCFVKARSGDKDMAIEKGTDRARVVADLLQLPPPFCLSRDGRPWVGVVGEVYQGRRLAIAFEDGSFDTKLQWTGFLMPAEYNVELWKKWQSDAAGLWDAAGLAPEERTDMQRRCLEAVSWISRSARAIYDEEKIIDCAIACELLLQPKSQSGGLTHAAAEGAAILLGSSADERREIEGIVERLFGLRGEVVHGRFPKVDPVEVEEFYWIAFRVVLAVGKKLEKWERMDDLLAWIKNERWT